MSTCRDLARALFAFANGELSPARQEELAQHLGACPPCALLVESYQITVRLARALPPAPMPPGCMDRLRAALAPHVREG